MKDELESLLSVLKNNVAEIDDTSYESYLPVVGSDVSVVAVPFGASVQHVPRNLVLPSPHSRNTLTLALWIKHFQGNNSTTMMNALEIPRKVVDAIVENDGSGYVLDMPYEVLAENENSVIQVGNIPYLVCEIRLAIALGG